ncbi:MAG: glycogen debranching protein GlgX [Burkholderiaceae bacterium]|nr:glycogen debranching protein GlgX [Burkholderiaceae bacterium]
MLRPGRPWPLGATPGPDPQPEPGAPAGPEGPREGVNFAVWAPEAARVQLCLFDAEGREEQARLDLPACSEGVWHGWVAGLGEGCVYGWRVHGPWAPERGLRFNPARLLLDPYAREVVGRYAEREEGDLALYLGHDAQEPRLPDGRDNAALALKARVCRPVQADLGLQPQIPREQTVLYEAHVRALTRRHPQIPAELRGSYAALAHPVMLAHYRRLGITALSLLPIHARADEARLQRLGLRNHWGYNTIAFFAPEPRYASGRGGVGAAQELREAIEALHRAGLEVLLDVVYNHTAEGDETGPTLSMRGLANAQYYRLDPADPSRYLNWTGCGNVLNLAEPRVVQLVIDSLRHWVLSYGVDGFRFDLAPVLGRDAAGRFDRTAPFFAALQADPVLARVKWIAEPWDLGPGGYQLGGFPTGWAEWNDQYRDTLRAWWLRGGADRGMFAHRFAASSGQFHHSQRAPGASVNFVTAHDGFTLRDLVSYDHKHNEANGEGNRDGHHHNSSWNCGVEGPTDDAAVQALRARLQRALLASLALSMGTPMLLAGDELGHSQGGNNNAYCQDNETTWLDWAAADPALCRFVGRWLALRRRHSALRIPRWLRGGLGDHHDNGNGHLPAGMSERRLQPRRPDVLWWHPDGRALAGADWSGCADRAMAVQLTDPRAPQAAAALLLVQPGEVPRRFVLPPGRWVAVAASHTADGAPDATCRTDADGSLQLPARSLILMLDNPQDAGEDELLPSP